MAELDPIEQEFIANVTRYVAGLQEMIAEGERFVSQNAADIASVEALQAAINGLEGKTVYVNVESSGFRADSMAEIIGATQEATNALGRYFSVGNEGISVERNLADDIRAVNDAMYDESVRMRAAADAAAELRATMEELGVSEDQVRVWSDKAGISLLEQDRAARTKSDTLRDLVYNTQMIVHADGSMSTAAVAAAMATASVAVAASHASSAARGATIGFGWWRVSLTALHWIITGTMELLAVLIPAIVAAGAAAAVGAQGFQEVSNRMHAVYTSTEALGTAYNRTAGQVLGMGDALQVAQNQANPQIWELLGAGIHAVNSNSGMFIRMGQDILTTLDAFAAKIDIELAGSMQTMNALFGAGAQDLTRLGEVFGNIGHSIVTLASQMPGLAEVLLGLLTVITGIINVALQFASHIGVMGVSIITAAMAIEEFMRWGGLLVNMLGNMGVAVADLGPRFLSSQRFVGVFMSLVLAIPNAVIAVTMGLRTLIMNMGFLGAAGDAAANGLLNFSTALEETLAGVTLFQAVIGVGLAVGLGILIDKLVTARSATQQWGDSMQTALGKLNVTQGMFQLINDLNQVDQAMTQSQASLKQQEQASSQLAASGASVRTYGKYAEEGMSQAQFAYMNAGAQVAYYKGVLAQLPPIQQQQVREFTNATAAAMTVAQQYGTTLPEAFALLDQSGLHLNTMFQANGQLTANAAQQILNLATGYKDMTGPAGALGNTVAAVNTQLGLQNTQLSKVNQAWDQFLANATGGTSSFGTLMTDITTIGNVTEVTTRKIQAFSQGNTGLDLSTTQVAKALESFGGTSAQVWQNYDAALTQAGSVTDWWRTAAASGVISGKQLNTAIADTAATLLPYTKNSQAAAAELGVLVQEAGGPAITNYQQLKSWIDQNTTSTSSYSKMLDATTTAMSNVSAAAANFSQTLQADVIQAIERGSVNLGTITTDARNFNNALKSGVPASQGVQVALNNLVDQMVQSGINADNVKAIIYQMGLNMHLTTGQAQQLAGEAYNLAGALNSIPRNVITNVVTQYSSTGIPGITSGQTQPGVTAPHHAAGWRVPGYGGGDRVSAMLEPGEAVVPKHLVGAIAPFLSMHGVPGFAEGGLIGLTRGKHPVARLSPMEKILELWASEIWRDDLRQYGRHSPIGLTEMQHLFGATKPGKGGLWGNPQYRFLERDMAGDMKSYYLKDIMYWSFRNRESALSRSESSEISFRRHRALQDMLASERHGLSASEREFYRYWAGVNLRDITQLRTQDARTMRHLQDSAQGLFRGMGYARGGLIPFGHYDQGGNLPPGLSLALNTTGRPEPVGGGGAVMHVHLEVGGREIANAIIPYMVGSVNRYGIRNSGKATGILRPT